MKFLKKYKIFILLLLIYVLLVGYCFLVFEYDNAEMLKHLYRTNVTNISNVNIANFSAQYKRKNINLHWDLDVEPSDISSVELYCNDQLLGDVSGIDEYHLDILNSPITTGDNYFKLVVKLQNHKTIEKTCYLKIKEAFDFEVLTKQMDNNQIQYIVSYYYSNQKPVEVPKIEYDTYPNQAGNFQFNQVETYDINNNFKKVNCYYTFQLNPMISGKLKVKTSWNFFEYNLTYHEENTFNIVR